MSETRPFAVYVHWPFCLSKCPYCDFNSHVREQIDEAGWRDALLSALDRQAELVPGRTVDSVFFGGGTPSLMSPATVEAVLERVARHFHVGPELEVTLEANPTSVEAGKFAGFSAAGVNRVSLGIQALHDEALRFLGRQHSSDEAKRAIDTAATRFERYSFDLIYARPGQTVAAWEAELAAGLALAGDHLSLYQLTIEPGTAFYGAHGRGEFAIPDDELAGDLYEATQFLMHARGLPAYEISNHAKPGQESRHNLVYWRYGDYLGVGPGAHGRLTLDDGSKRATRQERLPETWLKTIRAGGDGMAETIDIAPDERVTEMVMMGLRLAEGIPRARFVREAGAQPETLFAPSSLAGLIEGEFLILDETGLKATPTGRQRLNALLAALLG
jgi:putative oxygen-independent coproporphyrinogen III oxidase